MAVEPLVEELQRSLSPAADIDELRRQAAAVVRRHIGFDLAVWAVLDPATVMWASCLLDGAPRDQALEAAVFANEYGDADVLKLVDLATGPHIGTLSAATGAEPTVSARFREVLAPRGFSDELRMVFSDGRSSWGALCLLRTTGRYDDTDVAALAPTSRPFATALQTALLRDGATGGPIPAAVRVPDTGIVVFDRSGEVLDISDEATALLGSIGHVLPQGVHAAAARHTAGLGGPGVVRSADGRWLTVHATRLGGSVAVVVAPAGPHQVADVVVRARGLTARERDVLGLIVRGMSNRQIARQLALSEWTVQDHVKAVMVKFAVTSRSQLPAALFFDGVLPVHGT